MMPVAAISVLSRCAGWTQACPPAPRLVRAAARQAVRRGAAASGLALPARIELGIKLGDDACQQRLNRDYRGVDMPTNVLAFRAWRPGETLPPGMRLPLGDVVLAFETVSREAREQGKPLVAHLSHLTVHGVLHLLGYDHLAPGEALMMESLEISILADLGVADPYRDTM
jgi:probable rRNA maturation factor